MNEKSTKLTSEKKNNNNASSLKNPLKSIKAGEKAVQIGAIQT